MPLFGLETAREREDRLKNQELITDLVKQHMAQGERAIIPEQTQTRGQLTTRQLPARIEQYGIKSPLMGMGSEKVTTTTPAHMASDPEVTKFILNYGKSGTPEKLDWTKGIVPVTQNNIEPLKLAYPGMYKVGDTIDKSLLENAFEKYNANLNPKKESGVVSYDPIKNKYYKGSEEIDQESLTGKEKISVIKQSPEEKKAAETGSKIKPVYAQLDMFEKLLAEMPIGNKPWSTAVASTRSFFSPTQATQELGNIEAYKKQLRGMVTQIVKSLGNVGSLSDRDIEAGVGLLPQYPDTNYVRAKKLDTFRNFLSDLESNNKSESLPTGLTEDDIEHNIKLYGVTRQQIIDKFKNKYKGQ